MDNLLQDTGERMIPEFHKGGLVYAEHLTRYMSAQDVVVDKTVLDIASGSGYGSSLLATTAEHVHGVDISEEAVAYAQANFGSANVDFRVGDGTAIPLDNDSVDVAITFETIEHIEDYDTFLSEITRVLKPDGLAIVSTPNEPEFVENNHFHVHEFEYDELVDALKKHFRFVVPYFQTTWKFVTVAEPSLFESEGRVEMTTVNLSPLTSDKSLYFYMLCSNREVTEQVRSLGALGEHYSDRRLVQEQEARAREIAELQQGLRRAAAELAAEKAVSQERADAFEAITNSRSYRLALLLAKAKNFRTR